VLKKPQQSVLAAAPDERSLTRFVQLLNLKEYWNASPIEGGRKIGGDYLPIQTELRRLVQAWRDHGQNVLRLLDANPTLSQAAQQFRPYFIPTEGTSARLAFLTPPEYSDNVKPEEIAIGLFLPFLLNPANETLRGPCKECGDYFVKKEPRHSVYCKRKCALKHTSKAATRKKRREEYIEKLERARRFSTQWCQVKHTSKEWKEWVSKAAQISKNWLTRAVNEGDLIVPSKTR
jgi:hypothetical protein